MSLALLPLSLLWLGGCEGKGGDESPAVMIQDTLTFLALGDSYTIGEAVDSTERWPVQLAGALEEEGVPTREPRIVAQTGWTTDELAQGIHDAGVTGRYGLVTLLIGVNNQYRGGEIGIFRRELVDLLDRAVAFAEGGRGRVLVLSIPDWGVTPFAQDRDRDQIAREIDAFNGVVREEAEASGVRYLDVTGISRRAGMEAGLVAEDGLHPSGAMYALWVEEAVPLVREMLREASEPGREG